MSISVTPVSKSLSDLLKESFFQIPRFQRPYDWNNDNISDFWTDLIDRDDDEYFMGSIVVFRDKKDKSLLSVVDGQQRLTTITIFLSLLRDAFRELGDQNLADAVQGYIQTSDDDNKQKYVLSHSPAIIYLTYRRVGRTKAAQGSSHEYLRSHLLRRQRRPRTPRAPALASWSGLPALRFA